MMANIGLFGQGVAPVFAHLKVDHCAHVKVDHPAVLLYGNRVAAGQGCCHGNVTGSHGSRGRVEE